MTKVLDASALLEYLNGGEGCAKIQHAIETAAEQGKNLLMSVVNWGEVYYVLIRKFGQKRTEEIAAIIATLPIEISPADQEVTRQAAIYKAVYKLPYADSFAAALAKIRRAELFTADHDFRAVEKDVHILWI